MSPLDKYGDFVNNQETNKVLSSQRHWEKMYTENVDTFGKEPSYPVAKLCIMSG